MSDLSKDLVGIACSLEELGVPYALMGGMASSIWGEPRYTTDVDLYVGVPDSEIDALILELGRKNYRFQDPAPGEFARRVMLLRLSGPCGSPIDLVLSRFPPQENALKRKRTVQFQGHPIHVCSPEDIILAKVISDRTKDADDIRGILSHQRGKLDMGYIESQLSDLCRAFDEFAPFDRWRKLKSEAEEDERLGDTFQTT